MSSNISFTEFSTVHNRNANITTPARSQDLSYKESVETQNGLFSELYHSFMIYHVHEPTEIKTQFKKCMALEKKYGHKKNYASIL
ncbi:unnamed protein product [Chironomus riparius]|uniref:Uncharacterized protein n=1 Tax=Chironomus riparius TaxID=315576 RepID=A0A9N9RYU4_9DIPT|nr:unnamed protein product [Chironomus riparius]